MKYKEDKEKEEEELEKEETAGMLHLSMQSCKIIFM